MGTIRTIFIRSCCPPSAQPCPAAAAVVGPSAWMSFQRCVLEVLWVLTQRLQGFYSGLGQKEKCEQQRRVSSVWLRVWGSASEREQFTSPLNSREKWASLGWFGPVLMIWMLPGLNGYKAKEGHSWGRKLPFVEVLAQILSPWPKLVLNTDARAE